MTDGLPDVLLDEASTALTAVLRLTLPAERWEAVGEAVNGMDAAVWAEDEKALRAELKNLRGAVIGTAPRPQPGEGVAPKVDPLSYRTTDYATRTPVRWISAVLVGGAVALATLVVLLMVVLTVGDTERDVATEAVAEQHRRTRRGALDQAGEVGDLGVERERPGMARRASVAAPVVASDPPRRVESTTQPEHPG